VLVTLEAEMRFETALVLVGLMLVTACGGSPTAEQEEPEGGSGETGYEEVLDAIDGLSGEQRTEKLVSLAEEEGGQLSLYTSMTSDVEDAASEAFGDAYDIDVSVYRADSETVLQRLVQEADADFHGSDVVETNGPELFSLSSEETLVPYESEYTQALVEGSTYDDWVADRFNKFVISYNTDEVSEGDRPASWEDLADPRWDGQLAMELEDIDWYKTLWEYWVEEDGKSEEEADQLFSDIAQGAIFVKGHTVMGDLLAAGEYSVAASNYSYLVQNIIEKGAPVAWEPPAEPVISRPNGVALVEGAPHPATAILFVDWILSDGQEVLQEFNLDPARADIATAPQSNEIFVDLDSLSEELDEWTKRYEELVDLGEVAD
jgi:iron(III) transport system substrate-binding protein